MVDYVSDVIQLMRKFRAYAHHPDTPDALAEKLQTIPGNDADVMIQGADILYAHYDELSEQGKRVCAEMFNYAVFNHWTAHNRDGRSAQIVAMVAHDLGDRRTKPSGDWPEPEANRRDGVDWRPNQEPPAPAPAEPVED